jgi:hypothetical protein
VVTSVGGEEPAENCDADELPAVNPDDGVTIVWELVTMSHASLPPGSEIVDISEDVIYYEFVAEIDETPYKSTSIVPANVNEWTIPEEFIDLLEGLKDEEGEPIEEIKFEILVRVDNGDGNPGNKSAVESCFEIE